MLINQTFEKRDASHKLLLLSAGLTSSREIVSIGGLRILGGLSFTSVMDIVTGTMLMPLIGVLSIISATRKACVCVFHTESTSCSMIHPFFDLLKSVNQNNSEETIATYY